VKTKKRRIGPRVFLQLFALLLAVSLGVFLAFNLFFTHYVNSDVRGQLDTISAAMSAFVKEGRGGGPEDTADGERFPDLSHVLENTIRTEARIFNLDSGCAVTDYNKSDDKTEITAIAAALKKEGAALDGAKYVPVKTETGEYVVSSIADPMLADRYMVFAVEVTGARALEQTINAAMAAIMAAATLVCLAVAAAIARSVTEPVKELTDFAGALGSGDFRRRELAFRDAEFSLLADSMNSSAGKLEEYDTEQRTFFQNVSHELRTPLMSIRCYAEGISCGVMEPKKSGAVIIAETDRLSGLVEDLLYISRMDKQSAPEKTEEGDLRETAATCASGLAALAEKNGIRIAYAFDTEPVTLRYNENHIFRAVGNLLSNALRYAKSAVTLECRNEANSAVIRVTDDGPGVSAADLPHVFERFYKGPGGKAGIGLAIVRSVAELYGGTAAAYPGPGGRFELRFPKTAGPAASGKNG